MERHSLLHEFPELAERIHTLKVSDVHFRKLFDAYDELEHQIHRINTSEEVVTDEHAHVLKAKLLHLKDDLYRRLQT